VDVGADDADDVFMKTLNWNDNPSPITQEMAEDGRVGITDNDVNNIEVLKLLHACCMRMGVSEISSLYEAVRLADEAIKKYMRESDDSLILEWWKSREF
jgi:hypothetical protein